MNSTLGDASTVATTEPSSGTTLATLGFLMGAAGPILMIIASVIFGIALDDAAFFVIPTVAGLAGAALVRRGSTALKAVAIVLALVVGATVFWTAFGLAAPASFFDFVPGTLVLPGVLLAIVATITSIVTSRSGKAGGAGERRAAGVIVAVLGLLAIASAILTVTGRDTVPDALADEADLTVSLEDFDFDEAGYDVDGGAKVLVKNDDPFLHTFTVDELGIDVDLGPGDEKLIDLHDESGTFVLYCEPHTSDKDDPSEDDMAAELTIG